MTFPRLFAPVNSVSPGFEEGMGVRKGRKRKGKERRKGDGRRGEKRGWNKRGRKRYSNSKR